MRRLPIMVPSLSLSNELTKLWIGRHLRSALSNERFQHGSMFDSTQIAPRPPGCTVPLTATQTWVWNDVLRRPCRLSRCRLCADSIRLCGPLDASRLQKSIGFVIRRHEALRTRIAVVNDAPLQIIDAPHDIDISPVDISHSPSKMRDAEARQLGTDFILHEVDLSAGPLFDAKLLRLSEYDHVLFLATDHIISDAASIALLSREIWTVYRQYSRQMEPNLPPVAIQFPDFAVWQHATQGSWWHDHALYWRQKLPETPLTFIPRDYEVSDIAGLKSEVIHFPMGKSLTRTLREAANGAHASLPLVTLALYSTLTALWCQRQELLVTALSHGRHGRPELKSVIGYLAHPLYLRLSFDDSASLLDIVTQTTREYATAFHHDASRLPAPADAELPTDVYFNWLPFNWTVTQPGGTEGSHDDLRIQPFPLPLTRPAIFSPQFYDTPSGIVVTVSYTRELFKQNTVESFGTHMQALARQFVEQPRSTFASLAWT